VNIINEVRVLGETYGVHQLPLMHVANIYLLATQRGSVSIPLIDPTILLAYPH
jgi:hypothetical protein